MSKATKDRQLFFMRARSAHPLDDGDAKAGTCTRPDQRNLQRSAEV